jgi:homoserine O-acetyltransferase
MYATHGQLNVDGSNAILVPSYYLGSHHGYDYLIGPGRALDPAEHFVIVAEMFGSGRSSSPSNMPPPQSQADFPAVTIRDNVEAMYHLVTDGLGIRHLKAIVGHSMGAEQGLQWAVSHPDFMDLVVAISGTGKTYPHEVLRLESALSLITLDSSILAGNDTLSSSGKATWAYHWWAWLRSPEYWRQGLFKTRNTPTIEAFIEQAPRRFPTSRPYDYVLQGRAAQAHDVGQTPGFGGDTEEALRSIRARVLFLPAETDELFPVEEVEYESQFIPDSEVVVIPTIWGHTAGSGSNQDDRAFLNETIRGALR